MLKTLKKLRDGLSTRVYKFFLWIFFKSKKGQEFSETYGVSFNPDLSLSHMPVYFPSMKDFYNVASDLSTFEIIKIDEESLLITIREIGSDTEHKIHLDLFDILFIKIEPPDTGLDRLAGNHIKN